MHQRKITLLPSQGARIIQEMTFFSKVNVHGYQLRKQNTAEKFAFSL